MSDSSRAMDAKQTQAGEGAQAPAPAAPAAFWPMERIRTLAGQLMPVPQEFTKSGTCRLLAVIAVSFGLPENQASYFAGVLETLAAYNTSAFRQQCRDAKKTGASPTELVDWAKLAKG